MEKDYFKLLKCWKCVIWIHQNTGHQNKLAHEFAHFYGSQMKGFYSIPYMLQMHGREQQQKNIRTMKYRIVSHRTVQFL